MKQRNEPILINEVPSAPRAALYMRVSTGRQAEHDLSIPDQRAQLQSWCSRQGYEVVAEFVEAGASATDDRRPASSR
jgi:site-specific DNA recombinase